MPGPRRDHSRVSTDAVLSSLSHSLSRPLSLSGAGRRSLWLFSLCPAGTDTDTITCASSLSRLVMLHSLL